LPDDLREQIEAALKAEPAPPGILPLPGRQKLAGGEDA
jgi:hypothetical protein